jgi:hypothetical protein
LLALVLVILLLGSGGGGAAVLHVDRLQRAVVAGFHSAQSHLEHGRQLLSQAATGHNPALIGQARTELHDASADFSGVRTAVTDDPLLTIGGYVPGAGGYVGPRVQAVLDLAEMGIALTQALGRAADVDALFVSPPDGGPQTGMARLLAVLDAARPTVARIQTDLQLAARTARRVDPAVLPGVQRATFRSVQRTIQRGLAALDQLAQLLPAVNDLLGGSGPRTYLLEQVNPFELRAGGGYIGTFSLLSANRGELKVIRGGDVHQLPDFGVQRGAAGYVAPPPPLGQFLGNQSWNLGDSNFFPDFESNARAAADFSQKDFGVHVDGVISLDVYAIGEILQLTGPIQVPGTTTAVTPSNLTQVMIQLDILDPAHKQVLGALAGPLMAKMTALGSDRWAQLLNVLNQEASQRHLQIWAARQAPETQVQHLGWSGGVAVGGAAGGGDFFYPLESNFGVNKDNYFLSRQYMVDVSRTPAGLHDRVQVNLTLDLTHAPLAYTPSYRAYVRFLVPSAASGFKSSNLSAEGQPTTSIPPGTKVIEGWFQIEPNPTTRKASAEIVVEYDIPWSADSAGRHRIYWEKQPGTLTDMVALRWNDGGRTVSTRFDLRTDRTVELGTGTVSVGIGRTATAALPRISF